MAIRTRTVVSSTWRDFEKLVARIESAAGPRGIVVKSPDRIRDMLTGRMREVDVSIRQSAGSVALLVTVECRKRSPKQDVTWIEQLATKRSSIGAAKTIAVSPRGFSDPAHRVAELKGIELRVLKEVSATDIDSWLSPGFVVHIFRHAELRKTRVRLQAAKDDVSFPPLAQAVDELRRSKGIDARVFNAPDGAMLTLNDIWLRAQSQHDFFAGIPCCGKVFERSIELEIEPGELSIETIAGPRHIHSIELEVGLSLKQEQVRPDAKHHQYKGPDGTAINRTELTANVQGLGFKMALQNTPGSRLVSVEIEATKQHDASK